MMRQLKNLRVRFALWTASLLLVALTLFSIFVYLRMAQNLAGSVDDALTLAAAQIITELDVEENELVAIDEFVRNRPNVSLFEQGFSFAIVDNFGQTLQVYGPYALPRPQANFTTPDQTGMFSTFTDTTTGHTVRIYTTPVIEEDRLIGAVQVALNLNSIRQTLNQLLTTLLTGTVFIVLIAGVGGYGLATQALAPIDKITRTARQISTQDLSARLNLPPTDDEVGRLAITFDTMLARLDDGFRRERQFTADASHELRTPLTTMQTILSSTLARQRTPAKYQQALADLAEETDRMKLLAEGLLLLARSDTEQSTPHETLNLSVLLQDVIDSLQPLAKDKKLDLVCQLPPQLNMIGDSDGLIRLFVNLLGNAIKYTEQGRITTSLRQQTDNFIEIAITDTGIGIAPEHLPYIFDRFYRVDKSRATSGAGLGLAIATSVTQAHSGSIRVASQVGTGTEFIVQLAKGY